jgi:hypothetical protein
MQYKFVLFQERTNVSPSDALNTHESLMEDLTTRLNEIVASLPEGTTVCQYQLSAERAGGRRHYVLLEIPE